jgi:hypothetical protein
LGASPELRESNAWRNRARDKRRLRVGQKGLRHPDGEVAEVGGTSVGLSSARPGERRGAPCPARTLPMPVGLKDPLPSAAAGSSPRRGGHPRFGGARERHAVLDDVGDLDDSEGLRTGLEAMDGSASATRSPK